MELMFVFVRVNGGVVWPFAAWAVDETEEAVGLLVRLHIEARTGTRPVAVDGE